MSNTNPSQLGMNDPTASSSISEPKHRLVIKNIATTPEQQLQHRVEKLRAHCAKVTETIDRFTGNVEKAMCKKLDTLFRVKVEEVHDDSFDVEESNIVIKELLAERNVKEKYVRELFTQWTTGIHTMEVTKGLRSLEEQYLTLENVHNTLHEILRDIEEQTGEAIPEIALWESALQMGEELLKLKSPLAQREGLLQDYNHAVEKINEVRNDLAQKTISLGIASQLGELTEVKELLSAIEPLSVEGKEYDEILDQLSEEFAQNTRKILALAAHLHQKIDTVLLGEFQRESVSIPKVVSKQDTTVAPVTDPSKGAQTAVSEIPSMDELLESLQELTEVSPEEDALGLEKFNDDPSLDVVIAALQSVEDAKKKNVFLEALLNDDYGTSRTGYKAFMDAIGELDRPAMYALMRAGSIIVKNEEAAKRERLKNNGETVRYTLTRKQDGTYAQSVITEGKRVVSPMVRATTIAKDLARAEELCWDIVDFKGYLQVKYTAGFSHIRLADFHTVLNAFDRALKGSTFSVREAISYYSAREELRVDGIPEKYIPGLSSGVQLYAQANMDPKRFKKLVLSLAAKLGLDSLGGKDASIEMNKGIKNMVDTSQKTGRSIEDMSQEQDPLHTPDYDDWSVYNPGTRTGMLLSDEWS